jgi:hypothetical protein
MFLAWRYRLDDHVNRSRAANDTGCRVSLNPQPPSKLYKSTNLTKHSFFYSGLARRKSALSLLWLSVMATAVVSFQWFFWGYSLAFSHKAGKYIGALDNFGLMNVLGAPSVGSPRIPDLLFCVYQGMFAAITYVPNPNLTSISVSVS